MRVAEMTTEHPASQNQPVLAVPMLSVTEKPVPICPPGGALLKLLGCGLCGSDLDKVLNQKAPPGTVLGHEVVGQIEYLDTTYQGALQVGQRVATSHHTPCGTCHYCLTDSESMCATFKASNLVPGGFAEQIALSGAHLAKTVFPIPNHISDAEASCIEPLGCVIRGVRRTLTRQSPSQPIRVLVFGLGFIGLMAAQLYQQEGYQVTGVDISPERVAFAREYGFANQVLEALPEHPETGFDIVFLSVVNPALVTKAIKQVRDGGLIMQFTSSPQPAQVDINPLYFREITWMSSYSPASQDLKKAAELIFNQQINVKVLITHHLPLSQINEGIALYRSGQAIKVLITP